jgi:hypothetical protein
VASGCPGATDEKVRMEFHTIDLVNKLDEQLSLEVLWIGTREHDERAGEIAVSTLYRDSDWRKLDCTARMNLNE